MTPLTHDGLGVGGVLGAQIDAITRAEVVSGDEEALETMITHLSPGPQYEGLRKEYARYTQIAEAMELPEHIAGRHAWTPTHKGKSYVVRGTVLHDLRSQTLKGAGGGLLVTSTKAQDTARSTAR